MARSNSHDDEVLVIGLGRFGAAAALELRRLGHRVTAIEKDGFLAEKFLGRISHVVHGDASDVEVIRDAKPQRFPKAVVAIGSSVEASVLACANLVDVGVPDIWGKALSPSTPASSTGSACTTSSVPRPTPGAGSRTCSAGGCRSTSSSTTASRSSRCDPRPRRSASRSSRAPSAASTA